MAERLTEWPQQARKSKYPWHEWLDGSVWRLRRGEGEDFKVSIASFRAAASRAAKERNKSVSTQVMKDEQGRECLVIQARPGEEP